VALFVFVTEPNPVNSFMRIFKLISLLIVSFFTFQCVETLITVNVFPDGKYHMKFLSKGDKEDIYDLDFPLPKKDPWLREISKNKNQDSDDSVYVASTEAILSGATIFHPPQEDPGVQRHPIIVNKNVGVFSTSYELLKVFSGRKVHQKYPLLAKALSEASSDSIDMLIETEIIMYCLKMGMKDILHKYPIKELTQQRILNHFRGVFYKAEEEGNLFGILNSSSDVEKNDFVIPESLIRINFRPFADLLPQNYVDECLDAMETYINEANITVSLNDDTYKFACTLPGRIAHSNADSTANDTLWWSFSSQDFLNDDYVIKAASVVYYETKIQRIIVASALVILFVLIFLSKKRKRS